MIFYACRVRVYRQRRNADNKRLAMESEALVGLKDTALYNLDRRLRSLSCMLSGEGQRSEIVRSSMCDDYNGADLLEGMYSLYSIMYPRFVSELKSYGLSDADIGFCCLLVRGYSNKEIDALLRRSGSHNVSKSIRDRIGLTRSDTRLSIWLKGRLKAVCPGESKNSQRSVGK